MGPLRIGTTSFVYPAGWLDNVERLAGRVQDIEILFFDVDDPASLPSAAETRALAERRQRYGLTYSLHTPLDASLASLDEARRKAGVRKVLLAIEAARPVSPSAYVVHVYLGEHEHDQAPVDLEAWRQRATQSLTELLDAGIARETLCVESLDYDLSLIEPVVDQLGLSVALDIGHLHRDGRDLRQTLERYLPRTRIIQWHGTDPQDRDHRSLEFYPAADARWLLETLCRRGYDGVLTLEVFRPEDFEASLRIVEALLREVAA